MSKEEILKAIMDLPKVETNNPISAMNSISVDDLMSAADRFNKVPTYDELLKENQTLKEVIEEVREVINKMVHYGYAKGVTLYMATTEDSEFGIRAKVLLQILDKAKENK